MLLLLLVLSGCGPAPRRPDAGKLPPAGTRVVVIGPSQAHPQWPAICGGISRYAPESPLLRFEFLSPPTDQPAQRLALLREHSASPAICLWVDDSATFREELALLAREGRVIVTMGNAVEGVTVFGHVEVNLAEGAEILGRALPRIAAGRISYVLVHENGLNERATRCYERFSVAARASSAIALLEERSAALGGVQHEPIRQLIARFPNVGLVVTLSPAAWLAERPALRLGPRHRFATLSAVPPLWPRLQFGEAAGLVGWLDGEIGYHAARFAAEGLNGELAPGRLHTLRCELVLPDGLESFMDRYAQAAGLPLGELRRGPVSRPSSPP